MTVETAVIVGICNNFFDHISAASVFGHNTISYNGSIKQNSGIKKKKKKFQTIYSSKSNCTDTNIERMMINSIQTLNLLYNIKKNIYIIFYFFLD